jgi:hypothetical protein
MSHARLADVLRTGCLFFSRPEKQRDPYEGYYLEEARAVLPDKVPKYLITASEKFSRKNYCINCWHLNQGESAAMWDLYGNSKGIAIRSTVGRLKESLKDELRKICLCKVEYGEARNALISPLCSKRKSFEHEREIRLYLIEPDRSHCDGAGTLVSVNLNYLIQRVYLAPNADPEMRSKIEHELYEHGVSAKTVQSRLYSTDLV